MKNTESKNRIASIYPSPGPNSPNFEDALKQELDNEIRRVETELKQDFEIDNKSQATELKTHDAEVKKLGIILNKQLCANKAKTNKLESLKNFLDSQKNYDKPNDLTYSQGLSTLEKLKKKIREIEEETDRQLGENEILTEMKNKEIIEIKSFKFKVDKELKSMQSTEKLYEKERNFSYLLKLQNLSVQQSLQKTKKIFQDSEESFLNELCNLKNTKFQTEKEIKQSIENISKANLKSKASQSSLYKIQNSIEGIKTQATERASLVRKSNQKISEIRKQLQLIQQHYLDCPRFSEPLSEEDIKFITSAYSKVKFQGNSLRLKFEMLTEEQLSKKRKCDLIRQELEKIKQDERLEEKHSGNLKLTYNEIKSVLDDQKILENKQVFEYTQKHLLRIYLKIQSITSSASNSLLTISQNSVFHLNDSKVLHALEDIKNLNRNSKNTQNSTLLIKRKSTRLIEKKKTSRSEFELNEDSQGNRLSLRKINEVLKKFHERLLEQAKFGGDHPSFDILSIDECAKFIQHDSVACFFIDISDFNLKILDSMNSSFKLITEVHKIGSRALNLKLGTIISSFTEIINWVKHSSSRLKTEIFDLYKNYGPESLDLLEAGLGNKASFRVQLKFLLEVSEKNDFKHKKKFSEESISRNFSGKSQSDEISLKSRAELPTADKSIRSHNFNFKLASMNGQGDRRSFESRIKSLSTRNFKNRSMNYYKNTPSNSTDFNMKRAS